MPAPNATLPPLSVREAQDLDEAAVYVSPLGRRCRWWPTADGRVRKFGGELFLYDVGKSAAVRDMCSDGFQLTHRNLRILRGVAP